MPKGEPIKVFNHGNMGRDFTYIDDIVESIARLLNHIPHPDPDWDPEQSQADHSSARYRLYNIGNNAPGSLIDFMKTMEHAQGRKLKKNSSPCKPGMWERLMRALRP